MNRFLHIFALIVAGEMVFSLPFHTARFFRPTLLEAFNFSNTELGDIFAVYGVVAMLSYFPGGVIADHFSTRKMLSVSLWATAAGGLYMATFPGALGMALLYGYWGGTTILLFWAALISATRNWGGTTSQGTAFGILDGGRGLLAAVLALFAVSILGGYLPLDARAASMSERMDGFQIVILFYTATTAAAGFLTWFMIPYD
jgi:sugar phosphate permease